MVSTLVSHTVFLLRLGRGRSQSRHCLARESFSPDCFLRAASAGLTPNREGSQGRDAGKRSK